MADAEHERGFRSWFKRHGRSRSRTPQVLPEVEPSAVETKALPTRPAEDCDSRSRSVQGGQHDRIVVQLDPNQTAPQPLQPQPAVHSAVASDQAVVHVPPISVSEAKNDCKSAEPTPTVLTPFNVANIIWREAYNDLCTEKPDLIEHYEAVLKEQSGVSQGAPLQESLADVAMAQRRKSESKQWQFQWFGKAYTVRGTIERILEATNRFAGLVSIGMSYAPPYVSLPWSSITALLPLMMNEFSEHQGAVDGLETVAKLLFCYRMAEESFLQHAEFQEPYKKSVFDLYQKILEYQALAVAYFGKSTLRRLGRNSIGSTEWQDMPQTIRGLDDHVRRSLTFMNFKAQEHHFGTLGEFMERQEELLRKTFQATLARRDGVDQVLCWISSIPAERDHADVRDKLGEAHFTSGHWFLSDETVGLWMAQQPGFQVLWLRGGVGAGKSSLISILIEDLICSASGKIAFFYCSRKAEKDNQKLTARNANDNILRNLLKQFSVSTDGNSVFEAVQQQYHKDKSRVLSGYGLNVEECVAMLQGVFAAHSNSLFTLIIDALDECTDYDKLLSDLRRATCSFGNVRIFFTSRFQVKVHDYFPTAKSITIDTQNAADIRKYLDIEIPRRRLGCGMTDMQAERLGKALLSKADGMFMWVRVQLNLFLHPTKARRIRIANDLERMLTALEQSKAIGEERLKEVYDDVYDLAVGDENQSTQREVVTTALRWVLCAFRNLTIRELAFAASVTSDGKIADGLQEDLIAELCSNLLIEDTTGIVRLAHLSVRHYLQARIPPDFEHDQAHLQAALTCLYLRKSPIFVEVSFKQSDRIQFGNVTLTRDFYTYVSSNWSRHCREAPRDRIQGLMASLLAKTTSKASTGQVKAMSVEVPSVRASSLPDDDVDILHEMRKLKASETYRDLSDRSLTELSSDWEFVVLHTVASGADLSAEDDFGHTIVHECVRRKNLASLRVVLEAGAPPDAQNRLGNTALHLAAMSQFLEGLQLLLVFGCNRNARNKRAETPLHLALMFCKGATAQALISANVDASARDHQGNTPLHHAAFFGQTEAAQDLLETGHSSNTVNEEQDTPLSVAINCENEPMVKLLLRSGVTVRAMDVDLARKLSSTAILHLLTNPRSDVPASNESPPPLLPNDVTVTSDNGSPLCAYCDVLQWIRSSSRGVIHSHWPIYKQLHDSARKGCSMCRFLAQQFEEHCMSSLEQAEARVSVALRLSQDQGARHDVKDTLTAWLGTQGKIEFECCLDESMSDDLPGTHSILNTAITSSTHGALDRVIAGRKLATDPLSSQTISLVKAWASSCDSSHPTCQSAAIDPLPTRVLDVGTAADGSLIRLLDSSGQLGKYAYLSFTGSSTAPNTYNTRSTLPKLMHGCAIEHLPRTMQDAVLITRAIGLQYLWISALCIIQDDPSDWKKEEHKMPDYLQHATFAIVAATPGGMDGGILHPREPPLLQLRLTQTVRRPGSEGFEVRTEHRTSLYLRRPLQTAAIAMSDTVLHRAWRIQEALLPQRLLIWGTDQIYWNCRGCLRSEGSEALQQPVINLKPRGEPVVLSGPRIGVQCSTYKDPTQMIGAKTAHVDSLGCMDQGSTAHQKATFHWYRTAMIFSRAELTRDTARLLALAGLAQYFDPLGEYAAGLWVDDLPNGLIWIVDEFSSNTDLDTYIAPTWSWVSVRKPITYCLWMGLRHDLGKGIMTDSSGLDPRFVVTDVVYTTWDNYPWGRAKEGRLHVNAMTKEVDIHDIGDNCQFFFDDPSHERRWRQGAPFTLTFISAWAPSYTTSPKNARCIGLVLYKASLSPSSTQWGRAGVFLGLDFDREMHGWMRDRLVIV